MILFAELNWLPISDETDDRLSQVTMAWQYYHLNIPAKAQTKDDYRILGEVNVSYLGYFDCNAGQN